MAGDTAQERTEAATPKRLHEAREKGQVARSRELSTLAVLLVSGAAMLVTGDIAVEAMMSIMREQFSLTITDIENSDEIVSRYIESSTVALLGILPFLAIVFLVAILAPMAVGGWIFSVQAFSIKFEKLNPLKGVKRMFSMKSVIELVKAILKFSIVMSVSILILYSNLNEMFAVGSMDAHMAIAKITSMLVWSFIIISSSMIIIALIDVPFQIWDHSKQLKMTHQEIKEEFKQTDGNPEQKRNIKERQRDMSQRRMMEEIPKADVIITNPSHYSVALRYDQDNMSAPIVVAKGRDLIAFQIRKVAAAHDIPVVAAPPLSRALYHSTELNQEIPAGLFMTVAQILAYIYRLKNGIESDEKEGSFQDMDIPEDYRRDD